MVVNCFEPKAINNFTNHHPEWFCLSFTFAWARFKCPGSMTKWRRKVPMIIISFDCFCWIPPIPKRRMILNVEPILWIGFEEEKSSKRIATDIRVSSWPECRWPVWPAESWMEIHWPKWTLASRWFHSHAKWWSVSKMADVDFEVKWFESNWNTATSHTLIQLASSILISHTTSPWIGVRISVSQWCSSVTTANNYNIEHTKIEMETRTFVSTFDLAWNRFQITRLKPKRLTPCDESIRCQIWALIENWNVSSCLLWIVVHALCVCVWLQITIHHQSAVTSICSICLVSCPQGNCFVFRFTLAKWNIFNRTTNHHNRWALVSRWNIRPHCSRTTADRRQSAAVRRHWPTGHSRRRAVASSMSILLFSKTSPIVTRPTPVSRLSTVMAENCTNTNAIWSSISTVVRWINTSTFKANTTPSVGFSFRLWSSQPTNPNAIRHIL